MGHAGGSEQLPVVALDGGLIADRQRGQHAGGGRVAHLGEDGVAHLLAQALHPMARGVVQALRRRRVAHVAGRPNALLEQHELVVEPVRVRIAVRLTQAHREAPALAGTQFTLGLRERGIFVVAPVPTERDVARHPNLPPGERRLLDVEAKAKPVGTGLGHAGDDAGQREVTAFQHGGEGVGQSHTRVQAGRAEPCERGSRQGERECQTQAFRAHGEQQADRSDGQRQRVAVLRPQRRLLQLRAHARQPGQREAGQESAVGGSSHGTSVGFDPCIETGSPRASTPCPSTIA